MVALVGRARRARRMSARRSQRDRPTLPPGVRLNQRGHSQSDTETNSFTPSGGQTTFNASALVPENHVIGGLVEGGMRNDARVVAEVVRVAAIPILAWPFQDCSKHPAACGCPYLGGEPYCRVIRAYILFSDENGSLFS